MKMLGVCMGLTLCVVSAEAFAQDKPAASQSSRSAPDNRGQHAGAGETPDTEAVHAAMKAYGKWLLRLAEATEAANTEVHGLSARWAEARRATNPAAAAAQFRRTVDQAKLRVVAASDKLRRLDTPDFPELDLSADIKPAVLVREMLALMQQTEKLLDGFNAMLSAMAVGNNRALEASAATMFESGELLLRSQAIIAEASLATEEKDSTTYNFLLIQARLFKSAARIVAAARFSIAGKPDLALARDLLAFAREMDAIAANGTSAIDATTLQYEALLESAGDDADPSGRALIRNYLDAMKIERPLFETIGRYTGALRTLAAESGKGPVPMAKLNAAVKAFGLVRDDIGRIGDEESRILARE